MKEILRPRKRDSFVILVSDLMTKKEGKKGGDKKEKRERIGKVVRRRKKKN